MILQTQPAMFSRWLLILQLMLAYLFGFCIPWAHGAEDQNVDLTATLAWDENTETNLAGYRIYWAEGQNRTNVVQVGLTNQTTIQLPDLGKTYSFHATAFNDVGLESDPSNVVSLSTPDFPRPPTNVTASIKVTVTVEVTP